MQTVRHGQPVGVGAGGDAPRPGRFGEEAPPAGGGRGQLVGDPCGEWVLGEGDPGAGGRDVVRRRRARLGRTQAAGGGVVPMARVHRAR